jgi:Glutathione peroxidase
MKKICYVALAALALSACNSEPKFKVEGQISGADGKMLYLEASALEGVVPLDSVKLKKDGSFSFKQLRPESPEFYRLRVGDKVINFSVDSTETVEVKAPYNNFVTDYTITGSPNCTKIKELSIKQLQLQERVSALDKSMQAQRIGMDVFEDSLTSLLKKYKDDVKMHYIFSAPNTAAAYFALFQKLNGYLIFDPLNSKDDIKCFAAVATSLNNLYPHTDRSKNLYNIVIRGMKNTHTPQQKVIQLPQKAVTETGIIDISLRDMKGNVRKLSDLKGKVVLLDFIIYQSAVSSSHNFKLRDLYKKYASQGLEIYQVSLDADEHFWKTSTDNLPWICVRDASGVDSSIAATYNVKSVPSVFLINRNSELSARTETIKDLEASVKALL